MEIKNRDQVTQAEYDGQRFAGKEMGHSSGMPMRYNPEENGCVGDLRKLDDKSREKPGELWKIAAKYP